MIQTIMFGVELMKKDILGKIGREIARRKRRERLTNRDFSIISNSCIGGVISNSLKERFNSPTINLIIWPDEFITFCNHLRDYSRCPLVKIASNESREPAVSYPLGIIRGTDYGLPDIVVRFVHYKSFDEAKQKWEERYKRINYDNIFIIMEHGMNASERTMDRFEELPYSNKVFLSSNESNERWPHNFNFSFYTNELYIEANVYNAFYYGMAQYRWLDEFDYITWLNSGKIHIDNKMKELIHNQIKKNNRKMY